MRRAAGPLRWLLAVALGIALAVGASGSSERLVADALAQARPRATTTAPPTASVDEPFVVELRVTSDEGPLRAEAPSLTPPIGLTVGQPSVSFFTSSTTIQGVRRETSEFRARWTIRARDPGRYVFEGPSVTVRGQRVRGNPVTVEVSPATSGGPSSPRAAPSPLSWPFGLDVDDEPPSDDAPEGELSLPSAPPGKDVLFLRAVPDKSTAYVGEQVTLSFYLYFRVPEVEWTDKTEAPLRDFLRVPLMRDPGTGGATVVRVGGRRWMAKLLDRAAIFPLRAGRLSTGSMTARFRGRRVGSKVLEESNDVVIEAIEPPEAGRPAGYVVGDVGKFELEADVKPRDLRVGDVVTVTLRVKGDGLPPSTLRFPRRAGVEWLDPDKQFEQIVRGGRVGGVRTFVALAKITRGGFVELGAVELPTWDPASRAYHVAKADLGGVRVEGASAPPAPSASASAPEAGEDALAALPRARAELRPFARAPEGSVPLVPFLAALAAPPALVLLAFAGLGLAGAARRSAAARRDAPRARVQEALDEARAADASGDTGAVAAAVERAVHAGVEDATAVRSRGARLDELARELEDAGLPPGLAQRVAALLRDCEALRFDPAAGDRGRGELVSRARALAKELASHAERGR